MEEEKGGEIWKSAKNPTKQDHEATIAFLALRKQYNNEFLNKIHVKQQLWGKIADALNQMGFLVGNGREGAEKCRQKFANLQNAYMKMKDKRRKTGEGSVRYCPYFEELDDILGDSHKADPVLVIDSIPGPSRSNCTTPSRSSIDGNAPLRSSNNNSTPSSSDSVNPSLATPQKENRFSSGSVKRSVRPEKKHTTIEAILKMNEENQKNRKEEFMCLLNFMKEQNQQRHEQILALCGNKKRKRRNCSESDG